MNMDFLYYIILGITVVSYLLGLFFSYFERKNLVSHIGNAGFMKTMGALSSEKEKNESSSRFDEEII